MSPAAPTRHPAWQRLGQLATVQVGRTPRAQPLAVELEGLDVDFSRQCIEPEVLETLLNLADGAGLAGAIRALFAGDMVNATEQRAALHTALRATTEECPAAVRDAIAKTRERQRRLVDALRSGSWTGYTGKPVRTVVNVGIGGSHLGPELVVDALGDDHPIACRFLANVDGHAVYDLLDGLDPETTLFVVASKSFGTAETRLNAETLRGWFLERSMSTAAIARHFLAVTANVEAASAFGIPPENVLPMWDWVGGRYSLWSAIGLSIAVSLGNAAFDDLLGGARLMDAHFRTAPPHANAPLLMALIEIWNTNFRGAQSHALLCYDRRLVGLVAYLQQLEMESNGKSVRQDGERSEVHTAPIVWGGEETNAQHAFHQLLYQGTRAFSADFIACANPDQGSAAHRQLRNHHRWLLAHCVGQSEAMLNGRAAEPAYRHIAGGHPSTTILIERLEPRSLGALLALYEHKVFCQGMIWDIDPFDQWGVELGKTLGDRVYAELDGQASGSSDPATRRLLTWIRAHRSTEQP